MLRPRFPLRLDIDRDSGNEGFRLRSCDRGFAHQPKKKLGEGHGFSRAMQNVPQKCHPEPARPELREGARSEGSPRCLTPRRGLYFFPARDPNLPKAAKRRVTLARQELPGKNTL